MRGSTTDSLWSFGLGSFKSRVVIFDGLEDLCVAVSRLDETLTLAFENLFCARDRWIDQGCDLETRTELVLESERVAEVSIRLGHLSARLLPGSFIGTKHDVLHVSTKGSSIHRHLLRLRP
jgi:hypothetical protein